MAAERSTILVFRQSPPGMRTPRQGIWPLKRPRSGAKVCRGRLFILLINGLVKLTVRRKRIDEK